jgi:hypothetical protein
MQEHYIEDKIEGFHDWDVVINQKIKNEQQATALIKAIEKEISSITAAFMFRVNDRVSRMVRDELLK